MTAKSKRPQEGTNKSKQGAAKASVMFCEDPLYIGTTSPLGRLCHKRFGVRGTVAVIPTRTAKEAKRLVAWWNLS